MKRLFLIGVIATALAACGNADTSSADPVSPKPGTVPPNTTPVSPNRPDPVTDPASPSPTDIVPPARDGNIAIEEEFQSAEIKGTVAAYELFMARHPDHDLSKLAKIRIAEIKSKR